MKKVYKTLTTAILLMLMSLTSMAQAEDYQKSFSKTYDVNADAQVIIANQYGNVAMESWEKNQVEINVVVYVKKLKEKDAMALLDKIDVEFSGSSAVVKALTRIDGNLNCRNCEFSIDYEVKMPASNSISLTNEFGNAFIGSFTGSVNTKTSYGNINLGKLENKLNKLSHKFGDMVAGNLKAADIEMEYGALEIGNAGYLNLYVRFASLEIGEVSELVLDGQYEDCEIGSVHMMRAKTSFMEIEISELFDKLDMTTTYGGLEVLRVASGFSSIDITTEFGGIDLGISSKASYSLKAESTFGDIIFPESRAEITRLTEKSFNKLVEAFVGDDKSGQATVVIKAKNSDIEIN